MIKQRQGARVHRQVSLQYTAGSPESSGRTMLESGLKGVRSTTIWAPGSLYLFLAETRASAKDLKCDMFGGFRIQQDGPSS